MLRPRSAHFLLVFWLAAVAVGFVISASYSIEPGAPAESRVLWPESSQLKRGNLPSLVVFAHPHCPCSSASIGELERLMPTLIDKAKVFVVFIQPKEQTQEWVQSSIWARTKKIPGVETIVDYQYKETDTFGARTSGQVYFYDRDGSLVYSGGITPGRGHMGDSYGRTTILAWFEGKQAKQEVGHVFGCALKEGKLTRPNDPAWRNDDRS